MMGCNFAPRGFAFCDGQLLSIAQNTALFALLGTTYGGNGTTTFGLPDLRGRFPMAQGNGPGLSPVVMGEQSGSPSVTLTAQMMPAHLHTLQATTAPASSASPAGGIWAVAGSRRSTVNLYTSAQGAPAAMAPTALGPAGGNQAHNNQSPYLVINFVIATSGIFPSRN
jgi:microcystin-dependent protein